MYISAALSIITMLYNHYHHPSLEPSFFTMRNRMSIELLSSFCLLPMVSISTSVPMNMGNLIIPWKKKSLRYSFCLSYFTSLRPIISVCIIISNNILHFIDIIHLYLQFLCCRLLGCSCVWTFEITLLWILVYNCLFEFLCLIIGVYF